MREVLFSELDYEHFDLEGLDILASYYRARNVYSQDTITGQQIRILAIDRALLVYDHNIKAGKVEIALIGSEQERRELSSKLL